MEKHDYEWILQRQNPSSMSSSSSNQSIGGIRMITPTEGTLYLRQRRINPNLISAPYSTQSTPYPHYQTARFPGYPGQAMSQPLPQQANPPSVNPKINPNLISAPYSTQSTPYPNNSLPYPNHQTARFPGYPGQAMSQRLPQQANPPSTNPMYEPRPTAPPASPACSSTSEYSHDQLTNNHTSTSSDETASFGTNPQIVRKLTPTALHNPKFNAIDAAKLLREAMKDLETTNKGIISIVSKCNNLHRQNIASTFKTLYGKNLIQDLQSEVFKFRGCKFENLIVAMMTPIIDYYVKEIHDSISGTDADKDVLIMILCTLKNQDIHRIRATYTKKYGKSLESDISGDRPGRFERLMVSLCSGVRDDSTLTDINSAKSDAKKLHSAEVGHMGTNESEFNSIFVHRNVHQLRLIFQEYCKLYGHDISQEINREFSGHMKTALLTIVKIAQNSALYFAEQLSDAMSVIGTRDQKLIFICVTRSEIDMGDIKNAFYTKYDKTLTQRISENTSGDYQKCLIELIGSNFEDQAIMILLMCIGILMVITINVYKKYTSI